MEMSVMAFFVVLEMQLGKHAARSSGMVYQRPWCIKVTEIAGVRKSVRYHSPVEPKTYNRD
jgi:hypothetical protein